MTTPTHSPMRFCPRCRAELGHRLVDGVERMACSPCGYVHWDNPIPVVAALVQLGDDFILARNARWPGGMFSLITGFLEKGELPESAISRETAEELGLEVTEVRFIGHYALPAMNQLLIAFAVCAKGELRLGEEIAEVLTLSRADLAGFDFGPLALTAEIVAAGLPKLAPSIANRIQ